VLVTVRNDRALLLSVSAPDWTYGDNDGFEDEYTRISGLFGIQEGTHRGRRSATPLRPLGLLSHSNPYSWSLCGSPSLLLSSQHTFGLKGHD